MPTSTIRLRIPVLAWIAFLIGITLMAPPSAFARESRTVAETWTVDIGFVNEPPIQNDTNGLWVKVFEGDQPVEGLEATLTAQTTFADQARELPLTPAAGQPGVYTSVFIPTQPGEYSFLLAGTIEGQPIEETFASSPEGVPLVASRLDYEFPTAAHGVVANVSYPVIAGAALLIAGVSGFALRRMQR